MQNNIKNFQFNNSICDFLLLLLLYKNYKCIPFKIKI